MAVTAKHIIVYGSANMALDDVTTNIGGAEDGTIKASFSDVVAGQTIEAVSSAAGDTSQTMTIYGRNAAGELVNDVITLNGLTPAVDGSPVSFNRLLRGVKSATTAGDVAVYDATPTVAVQTAQSATADTLVLHAGASGTDNLYTGEIVRILSGSAGVGELREIVEYDGTSKTAYVRDWGVTPTGTITFEISKGMLFEQDVSSEEITEIQRPFYNAAAEPSSGSQRIYYEKIFVHNAHASTALTSATIAEVAEGIYADVEFDLESTRDGTDTNGVGNDRQTEGDLSTYTFDSSTKDVANSQNFTAGASQGVWLTLTLEAGDAAADSFYKVQTSGQSI